MTKVASGGIFMIILRFERKMQMKHIVVKARGLQRELLAVVFSWGSLIVSASLEYLSD